MIESLSIENFRCFLNFEKSGFEAVNLIGGKNNSGKTCLLEAIACLSNKFQYHNVAAIRGEDSNFIVNKRAITNQLQIKSVDSHNNHSHLQLSLNEAKTITGQSGGNIYDITFITQKTELPTINILQSFDEFDTRLVKDQIIEILEVLDSRIEDMRTFKSKEGLYIKCKDEEYKPLTSFGDATRNVIRYFTPIFEKELTVSKGQNFSILLIDEIENGLHYSVHDDFWEKVFILSKRLNVQVFATTHSLEMIKAFNDASIKNGNGAYFEMGIDADTGEIFSEKHDAEQLNAELLSPNSTVRGE
jgi:AAA15 family ATPase/GTPase